MAPGPSRNRVFWMGSLLVLAAVLLVLPLVLHPARSFVGSDDRAAAVIAGMQTPMQPWFHPIWQPGSEEVKNVLFALQAAGGLALVVAFFVIKRRKRQGKVTRDS
jgi:cobalt transport protein